MIALRTRMLLVAYLVCGVLFVRSLERDWPWWAAAVFAVVVAEAYAAVRIGLRNAELRAGVDQVQAAMRGLKNVMAKSRSVSMPLPIDTRPAHLDSNAAVLEPGLTFSGPTWSERLVDRLCLGEEPEFVAEALQGEKDCAEGRGVPLADVLPRHRYLEPRDDFSPL